MIRSRESRATSLRDEAIGLEKRDPARAMELYVQAAREYADTWTVQNLVVDDAGHLAQVHDSWWSEAIQIVERVLAADPDGASVHTGRLHKLRLKSQGKHFEALDEEYQEVLPRIDGSGGLWGYARQFAEIPDPRAHDRAWYLYNKAAGMSAKAGQSPHNIRRDMADQLLAEGKAGQAVEMLITGWSEARMFGESTPKSMLTQLKKAMRADGFNLRLARFRELRDKLSAAARKQGREAAVQLYRDRKREVLDA